MYSFVPFLILKWPPVMSGIVQSGMCVQFGHNYSYRCKVDTTEIFQVQIGSKFKNVYTVLPFPNVITDRHVIIYRCSVYKGICEFR